MGERPSYGYGEPNWDLVGRWLHLDPAEDGPFWAVNLMRYKAVADAVEGVEGERSGLEADDAYAPLGPLAAVGARVVYVAPVVDQAAGEPGWDRVGVVRYPTRAAFFAMQQRDDFQDQHRHKEAGMAFTIVLACHPGDDDRHDPAPPTGAAVLLVERGAPSAWRSHPGVAVTAELAVEGVIVGDDRTWDRVVLVRADDAALAVLAERVADGPDEVQATVLDPRIDHLVESFAAD